MDPDKAYHFRLAEAKMLAQKLVKERFACWFCLYSPYNLLIMEGQETFSAELLAASKHIGVEN
jgi:hypothetical protein